MSMIVPSWPMCAILLVSNTIELQNFVRKLVENRWNRGIRDRNRSKQRANSFFSSLTWLPRTIHAENARNFVELVANECEEEISKLDKWSVCRQFSSKLAPNCMESHRLSSSNSFTLQIGQIWSIPDFDRSSRPAQEGNSTWRPHDRNHGQRLDRMTKTLSVVIDSNSYSIRSHRNTRLMMCDPPTSLKTGSPGRWLWHRGTRENKRQNCSLLLNHVETRPMKIVVMSYDNISSVWRHTTIAKMDFAMPRWTHEDWISLDRRQILDW